MELGKGVHRLMKEYNKVVNTSLLLFTGVYLHFYYIRGSISYLLFSLFFFVVFLVLNALEITYLARTIENEIFIDCSSADRNFKYVICFKGDIYKGLFADGSVVFDKTNKLIEAKSKNYFEECEDHSLPIKKICNNLCKYLHENVPDFDIEDITMYQFDIKEDKAAKDYFFSTKKIKVFGKSGR